MQKITFAIVLALTLSCVVATYTATNFVKTPVPVVNDGDTNYTRAQDLRLGSLNPAENDLYLVASNMTEDPKFNLTNTSYNVWTKKLESKSLSFGANTTYAYTSGIGAQIMSGFVFAFNIELDANNLLQIFVYQIKLSGNTPLPKFPLTVNPTNLTVEYKAQSQQREGQILYVYYQVGLTTINVTSFTIGGAKTAGTFTLTSICDQFIGVASGEAIKDTQAVALWREGPALKEALVDGSKAIVSTTVVTKYVNTTMKCFPYVTDKKLYGTFCTNKTVAGENVTTTYYVRTNTTDIVPLFSNNTNQTSRIAHFPYSGFYTFVFEATTSVAGINVVSYMTYDLNKLNITQGNQFLSYNTSDSTKSVYRIPGAGVYALLANGVDGNVTSVVAGLLLGSSYLASVFGFLLTVIAGLFLF
jgi:hypothetical protein